MNSKFERASLTAPSTPEQYRAAIERQERVSQKLRKERDELAARCERLRSALTPEVFDLIRCGIGSNYGGKNYDDAIERVRAPLIEAFTETPAASLAHVRAEAIEGAADRVDEWLNESDDDPVTLIRRSAALIRSQTGAKT